MNSQTLRLIAALALCALFHGASANAATQIPTGCQEQAPWGAPTYDGQEPTITPLCRTAYVALHDDDKLVPDFVSWELTGTHAVGCLARKDSFAPDPDLETGHRAELADYKGHPGYDRGHFAPNSDFEWDADVQRESFYLSNMSPQVSHLNQWEWEELEAATRAWAVQRGSLIVMDGPIWEGSVKTIGSDHVAIPTAYWKVIVDPAKKEALAFIMKNEPIPKGDLEPYAVSIDDVEKAAGFKFKLPDGVNRSQTQPLWAFDLAVFAAKKKHVCTAE